MNDALEEMESRHHLMLISQHVSMHNSNFAAALLRKGRIFYEEDDVDCVCSDSVASLRFLYG